MLIVLYLALDMGNSNKTNKYKNLKTPNNQKNTLNQTIYGSIPNVGDHRKANNKDCTSFLTHDHYLITNKPRTKVYNAEPQTNNKIIISTF